MVHKIFLLAADVVLNPHSSTVRRLRQTHFVDVIDFDVIEGKTKQKAQSTVNDTIPFHTLPVAQRICTRAAGSD